MLKSVFKNLLYAANFLGSLIEGGVDMAADLLFFRWFREKKLSSTNILPKKQKTGSDVAPRAKDPAVPETRYIIPPEILSSGR